MPKLYKVLGKDGEPINGGKGGWHLPRGKRPGKWMPEITGKIVACENGYHLCERKDILSWSSKNEVAIYEAEGHGDSDVRDDKTAYRSARLLRRAGEMDARTFRLFAADCAEHVLHLFERERPNDHRPRKAIQAARDYANGKIGAAAWAAAEAAARSAAGDAAGAAAWFAARDAAWDGAGDGERRWQEKRFWEYATGKRE